MLEELTKEGEYGRELINQYTRLLTIPIAIAGLWYGLITQGQGVIGNLNPMLMLAYCHHDCRTMLWSIGELITEYGVEMVFVLIFANCWPSAGTLGQDFTETLILKYSGLC